MDSKNNVPVFEISNFDYHNSSKFDGSFYIRNFHEHVTENTFIEKPHGHNFYLLLLVTKGSGLHTIDFLEYEVFPGAMFIVSPGQIHHWELSQDIDGHILFFTKEYFLTDLNIEKLTRFPIFNSSFSRPFIKLNAAETDSIALKYNLLSKEYKLKATNYHEMVRLYLNAIFIELSRVYVTNNEQGHEYNYDVLQLNRYEALVDKYYKKHRPISCYSKKMNLTDRQLSYLCKKTVNKTPLEILTERLILEAKRLIIYSDLSINAIANELNFNDYSYFIRFFKKHEQQTPDQFRISQLKSNKWDNWF